MRPLGVLNEVVDRFAVPFGFTPDRLFVARRPHDIATLFGDILGKAAELGRRES